MCKQYDVIIIGAGLGGLECATILSRQGMSVLVLEQQHQPGGCMQSFRRGDATFDTGLHYIGGLAPGQPLHQAFSYLHLLDLPWQRLDKEGFDKVTIAGETLPFAEGYDNFRRVFADRFPKEKDALCRFTSMLRQTDEQQLDMLFHPERESNVQQLLSTNAYNWMHETFNDPLLVNYLCGTSLKMELRKSSLPLYTFMHGNGSYISSSWRLKGHGNMLVNKLIDQIKENGGEVRCNTRVTELRTRNGRISSAVTTDGEEFMGSTFISSLHPSLTTSLVTDNTAIKMLYRRRMASLENSFGMFTVNIKLKPHSIPYMNFNRYLYSEANVWDISERGHSGYGILMSCPYSASGYAEELDLLTPMTWDECRQWEDTTTGRRGADYLAMKEQMTCQLISIADQHIGGLKDAVEHAYSSTPLTYRDYNSALEGNAYGIRKDANAPLLTFLTPRTPVENLFMTGQSIMLHGVHGTTMTSLFTCAEVLDDSTFFLR